MEQIKYPTLKSLQKNKPKQKFTFYNLNVKIFVCQIKSSWILLLKHITYDCNEIKVFSFLQCLFFHIFFNF